MSGAGAPTVRTVHFVVPAGFDDPARPSGGNNYDRRVSAELAHLGWVVRTCEVPGRWPWPDEAASRALSDVLLDIPDHAIVLVDGLIGCTVPDLLMPAAARLHLAVLVHMPLGDAPVGHETEDAATREAAVLGAAAAVITTSEWTRTRLLERYPLDGRRVHAAVPGADRAEITVGTPDGSRLLCVAAVARHKGHDVLLHALERISHLPWRCTWVGPLDREPAFVDELRNRLAGSPIADRVLLAGPRTGAALADAYAGADVLVLATRVESYGMVLTEALARALPVVAAAVGGVPEALGTARGGRRPGLLVRPEDPAALADALARWLEQAELRTLLRAAARERRQSLPGWATTARRVACVLDEMVR